jgi:hypothetical protein
MSILIPTVKTGNKKPMESNFNLLPNLYNVRSLKETNSETNQVEYSSDNILYSNDNTTSLTSELSNSFRMVRFNNPLISYDYKCGNYLGI